MSRRRWRMELPPPPNNINEYRVEEALELFTTYLIASGSSEKTIKSYKSAINDFIRFTGISRIADVTPSKIVGWVNFRLTKGFDKRGMDRRKRQATMHYYTIFLRKWLVWMGFPKSMVPVVKKPRAREVEALREEDIYRLLKSSRDELDLLIVSMLFETGLRANELLSLRVSDVDIITREVRVRDAKYGKERIVFLGPLSANILEKMIKNKKRSDKLVPLSYNGLYKRLKSMAKRAGIDPDRVRPHVLRHTFATLALKRGVSLPVLQKLLGHNDIKITEIYMHLLKDDLKREYDKAFMKTSGLQELLREDFISCPTCGRKIPSSSKYCPYCGTNLSSEKTEEKVLEI